VGSWTGQRVPRSPRAKCIAESKVPVAMGCTHPLAPGMALYPKPHAGHGGEGTKSFSGAR